MQVIRSTTQNNLRPKGDQLGKKEKKGKIFLSLATKQGKIIDFPNKYILQNKAYRLLECIISQA